MADSVVRRWETLSLGIYKCLNFHNVGLEGFFLLADSDGEKPSVWKWVDRMDWNPWIGGIFSFGVGAFVDRPQSQLDPYHSQAGLARLLAFESSRFQMRWNDFGLKRIYYLSQTRANKIVQFLEDHLKSSRPRRGKFSWPQQLRIEMEKRRNWGWF